MYLRIDHLNKSHKLHEVSIISEKFFAFVINCEIECIQLLYWWHFICHCIDIRKKFQCDSPCVTIEVDLRQAKAFDFFSTLLEAFSLRFYFSASSQALIKIIPTSLPWVSIFKNE